MKLILELTQQFKNIQELKEYIDSFSFVDLLKTKYGVNIPLLYVANIGKVEPLYFTIMFSKLGVNMDWKYYSGLEAITENSIHSEKNIEKRRLLMLEYGIDKFFKKVKLIQQDVYGELIEATIDGERLRFLKCIDGSTEKDIQLILGLREKGGLTLEDKRIHYIEVPDTCKTAKEAAAWTWNLSVDSLKDKGWDVEA